MPTTATTRSAEVGTTQTPGRGSVAARVVELDGLAALAGSRLGVSRWHRVTQHQIDQFADATGDHQWIYTDPERARSGPFGTIVAHGYLTLSVAPMLMNDVFEVVAASQVNYGIARVRFPAPVPVGSNVRLAVDLVAVSASDGWAQATFALTFELEDGVKPACVAEILFRYYPTG